MVVMLVVIGVGITGGTRLTLTLPLPVRGRHALERGSHCDDATGALCYLS